MVYNKCSATCGQGKQSGVKSLVRNVQNGGSHCKKESTIQMRTCNRNPCFNQPKFPHAGR